MFKKILLLFLCVLITITCFAGCSKKENNETSVQVQTQTNQDVTNKEENNNTQEPKHPSAQGVQTFQNEEVVAIKYLVYKVGFIDVLDKNAPQKMEEQIKETLTNYLSIYKTKDGITEYARDKVKTVVKNEKNYILESGKINGHPYKFIYTLSTQDSDYMIINCYIELDNDTSGVDAIVGQSFDLSDFN